MTARKSRDESVGRRQYIGTLVTTTIAALAGCSSLSSEETPPADGTPTPDETDTEDRLDDDRETPVEQAKAMVQAMSDGQFDAAYGLLTNRAQGDLSPGALESIWIAYTTTAGPFEEIVDTEERVESGFDAVDLTLAFAEGEHNLRVLTTEDGGVLGIIIVDEYESPEYVDQAAFTARDLTLETTDCLLDATATVPNADEDVPGVVLVHGSDPQGGADKNLTAGGTEVYRDLAEGLSSMGVAVLRYDRRSYACPNSLDDSEYTLDNVAVDDALDAIEMLRTVEGVDPDQIHVVGHSLGGMAAPRLATRDEAVAGIVALACPARSFYELSVDQLHHQATVGEYENEQVRQLYEDWSERVDRIRAGDYEPDDRILGYPGAFWDSLDEYDHIETARRLDRPLLFLQGDRDFQVTVEDDFTVLQQELGDDPQTQFERYEGLNHLFLPGEGPSVLAENTVRNTVDRRVIEDIATWIESV